MIIAVIVVYDTITMFTISIDVTSFDLDKPCPYKICKSGAYGSLETDAPHPMVPRSKKRCEIQI